MKKIIIFTLILILSFSIAYAQEKHPLTIEDLWSMNRIGDFDLSPDGKFIVFCVTKYNLEENDGDTDIWIMESDGSNLRPLKNSAETESQPKFTPDGKLISYRYKNQIWTCNPAGSNDKQLTDFYTGITNIKWFDDGKKFLFTSKVFPECITQDCNKQKDEAKNNDPVDVKVITELMYRHWDEWRGEKRSHLFLNDLSENEITDLTLFSPYDVPPLALGSGNDYNVSPGGNEAAFAMNKSNFLATSTNNDIFIIDLNDLKSNQETPANKISISEGRDVNPVYSPDGKYIAFKSMARAGFEADKQSLMLYDRETENIKNISDHLDISIGDITWSPDSRYVYYSTAYEAYNSIFKINTETGENTLLLKNGYNSSIKVSPNGIFLYFKRQRSNMPYEIFRIRTDGSELTQLTFVNKEILANVETNEIETFWCEGAEGAKVQSILVKPPFFNKSKKYPMIFLIHGGPQGHWSDNFHYRWNMQLFASRGYVVVAPNPRGSTGYGQKFTDEISRDWGGKVYVDLMNCYDYVIANFDFIDKNNTFAAGASYGGTMIAWIEGHTDRFNALVNHDGVYNFESMYGSTEELWFPEWDLGGTPWEAKELYEKWSPNSYVKNFKTPMLVIQGGKDYRVPESQAFELFTALQKMGVESKFVYFPNENHFVLKPQNARFWWNTIFDWFEQYKR